MYKYAQIERAIVQRNNLRSSQRDSSPNNSDPGRRRFDHVANQYLHPDGRGDKKPAQYRGVRGSVDLDLASFRGDRSDSRTQDTAVALKRDAPTNEIGSKAGRIDRPVQNDLSASGQAANTARLVAKRRAPGRLPLSRCPPHIS